MDLANQFCHFDDDDAFVFVQNQQTFSQSIECLTNAIRNDLRIVKQPDYATDKHGVDRNPGQCEKGEQTDQWMRHRGLPSRIRRLAETELHMSPRAPIQCNRYLDGIDGGGHGLWTLCRKLKQFENNFGF